MKTSGRIKDAIAIIITIICVTSCIAMPIMHLLQYRHDMTEAKIDKAYERLCDASYLIRYDTSDPKYTKAYYELRDQIFQHEDFFRKNYDGHVMVEVLMASDIVDRTNYLYDFRCEETLGYTKAYFNYYQDELDRVEKAYFENKGTFHPQYLTQPDYSETPGDRDIYWYWLP